MSTQTTITIPPGYREDSQRRLVHEAQIPDAILLRDSLVRDLAAQAETASAELARLKANLLDAVSEHIALVATQYGADITGATGDVRLESYDGRWKIERTSARRLVVGEQIHAAEQLVREYLDSETVGATPALKAIVDRTFRRSPKTGELNVSRLVDFVAVEIDDERWKAAQKAIRDSIQSGDSVLYFRAYTRADSTQLWRQIPLDFSVVRPTEPAGESDE